MLIFPFAALLNSFSMTALLLVFGLVGSTALATDIGIVQGATFALFYAFSTNARNLVLSDSGGSVAQNIMWARFVLVVPLAVAAYFLSIGVGGVTAPLALVLIVRRIAEWIGEISLAYHEQHGRLQYALRSVMAEILSFCICVALSLFTTVDLALAAIPWAFAPLLAFKNVGLPIRGRHSAIPWRSLLPHFGSTAIIGTSVYVFRLSISLLEDKSFTGELFTAFALGGIIPTIYGQALAPSMARRYRGKGLPRKFLAVPALMLLLAGAVIATVIDWPSWVTASGRATNFWLAVGFSIAGGAIMLVAASIRTSLIQHSDGREVFGPDLLANILIVTCVPFIFYILGPNYLVVLYVLSACFNLLFLWGAGHQWEWFERHRTATMSVLGCLLVLPVFFQLKGGLFRDLAFVFETNGAITRLPIPISAVALFFGIAILGKYTAAARTLTTVFFSAIFFVLTSLWVVQGNVMQEGAKLILLTQYLLPMFALILGEMYGHSSDKPVFERSALIVLALIVPAHLICTWAQGYSLLAPSLYLFSIYQHLQYLPMVVVAMGLMVSFSLWQYPGWTRSILIVLLPLLAIHTVASNSFAACAALIGGLGIFLCMQVHLKMAARQALMLVSVALILGATYAYVFSSDITRKFATAQETNAGNQMAGNQMAVMPVGLAQRLEYWRFYVAGVVESPRAFSLGHSSPPDRAKYPSAHNYWLDLLYNFGAVAMAPLMLLLAQTGWIAWKRRHELGRNMMLLGTLLAVAYLLLFENTLKVGLRQPYPGIIGFFIWGLLLARLSVPAEATIKTADKPVQLI